MKLPPTNFELQINWAHIIDGCKKQSPLVQEELYRHCYTEMIQLCRRYTRGNIEDASAIFNQAMLKVFQHIHQYNGAGELQAWIRRIVVNACIDHWRGGIQFQQKELNEDTAELLPVIPDVYNRIDGSEIIRLINELPKNTGLVFNLFAMEGYKHHEIGTMLGISGGTSKWHLNEARKLLKQKLSSLLKKEYIANVV